MDKQKKVEIESLFYEISKSWFDSNKIDYSSSNRGGVFSETLVVWLMILQRLSGKSLHQALEKELNQENRGIFNSKNTTSRKLRFKEASSESSGYSRARERVKLEDIKALAEHCYRKIAKEEKKLFVIDGYTLTVAHTKANKERWGLHRASNEKDRFIHYPILRVVSAYELNSGVSTLPEYGSFKTSEQELGCSLISKMPKGATVLGDRGFGNFTMAYQAASAKVDVLFRLTEPIFNRATSTVLNKDQDLKMNWEPSAKEKKAHSYNSGEKVSGRFIRITTERNGFKPESFYFFTTLKSSPQEIAELYLKRLRVETMIKYLKQYLKLEKINAKTPAMVEKELMIAILTFNLIASIMAYVASEVNLPINRISFSYTKSAIETLSSSILTATDPNRQVDIFLRSIYQNRIPLRNKIRSYPRVLKKTKDRYPIQSLHSVSKEDQ